VDYLEQVEAAWSLSDAAHDLIHSADREVGTAEVWERIFAPSPLVDRERTLREGGDPPTRVYLHSPYGLQFNAEQKEWLPFRHGPLDAAKLPSIDADPA